MSFEIIKCGSPLLILFVAVLSHHQHCLSQQFCIKSTDLHQRFSVGDVLVGASLNEKGFKHVYFVGDSVEHFTEECLEFLYDPTKVLQRHHGAVSGNASDRE
eukprot:scaffold71060_cov49-Prasinocladus_malaysianus.AAC.1